MSLRAMVRHLASAPRRVGRWLALVERLEELELRLRFVSLELSEARELLRHVLPDSPAYRRWMEETRGSFDHQWRNLPDGAVLRAASSEAACRFTDLPPGWFPGRRVLDAGCGNGRWTRAFLDLGARVTALDQAQGGLDAVRASCAGRQGLELRRHDLLEPLPPLEPFDLVWSFGVAHHTGDTYRAVRNVAAAVRPGGLLFLMLYGEPRWEELDDFRELIAYQTLRRELADLPFEERAARLRERVPADQVHGWFDAVSPRVNDLHRLDEVAAWLRPLGFERPRRTLESRNLHLVARRTG